MAQAKNALKRPRIHSAKKSPLEDLIPLKTPISVHIDICSLCNFRCSFCFQADTLGMKKVNLKRGFMDFSLFKKVVDELSEFPEKIKKVKIGNHGEPTMHPDLPEMVKYIVSRDVAEIVELFTNGSKLDPKLNSELIDAGLQRINVSLEGLTDERYLQVAGVRQSFSNIVDGVRNLYKNKTEKNSDLVIYVKIADQTHPLGGVDTEPYILSENEKKLFYEIFENICDEIYVEKIVPQWSDTQLGKQNSVGKEGMYGQKIVKWKKVCPFTFMYLHINCDGTVSPCTLDWPRKVIIGNANENTMEQIWRGERLSQLQHAMLAGKRKCINFCGTCSAPMVCVEENLDPHIDKSYKAMKIKNENETLKGNIWI